MRCVSKVTLCSAVMLALMTSNTQADVVDTSPALEATSIKQLDGPSGLTKNLDALQQTATATDTSALSFTQHSLVDLSLSNLPFDPIQSEAGNAIPLKMRMPFLAGLTAHSGHWNLSLAPLSIQEAVSNGIVTEDQARFSFEQQKAFYEWTQQNPSHRYLFVNVPTYDLHLYNGVVNASVPIERYSLAWQSKSIVGKPSHPSPDQSLKITSIKYNPTWTPTQSMINHSAVLSDGSWNWEWIDQHNFIPYSHETGEMITWSEATLMGLNEFFFVEPSGPKNTLGQIKFETNSQNYIYLHDTNTPWYFERNKRAISSGCVRVEKPLELSAHLLDMDISHVKHQLERPETHWERIEQTPFYFMYDIVEYNDEGQVVGAGDDPYGWYAEWLSPPLTKEIETFDMKGFDYEIKAL